VEKKSSDLVLIGDSLSTNFYVSGLIATGFRARFPGPGWAGRLKIENLSRPSNYLDPRPLSLRAFSERFLKAKSLKQMVHEILLRPRLPETVLLWIGHNNLDWKADEEVRGYSVDGKTQVLKWAEVYLDDVGRLLEAGVKKIYCFGLINFESFFKARREAQLAFSKDPKNFPYFEESDDIFQSMKPEFQHEVVALALEFNRALKAGILKLGDSRVFYSDCFAEMVIDLPTLNSSDAWHFSKRGIERLASLVLKELTGESKTGGALAPALQKTFDPSATNDPANSRPARMPSAKVHDEDV
jgi:hypothetical protein